MTLNASRRVTRRILTVVALAIACVVGMTGPAQALPLPIDLFDNNPASRWTVWSTGNGTGSFGNSQARLDHALTTGWTEISRDVSIGAPDSDIACGFEIQLRGTASNVVSNVNIEVINPNNWQYLALSQVQVSGQQWQSFPTPWWVHRVNPVKFRVSLLAAGGQAQTVHIDTMSGMCGEILD
ncbi:hypothetical protein K1W54_22590 [Micromonospora sp. CPCC 205371]|nr:hypothetical protein [Micromonospora sp. CPCC 205371]